MWAHGSVANSRIRLSWTGTPADDNNSAPARDTESNSAAVKECGPGTPITRNGIDCPDADDKSASEEAKEINKEKKTERC